MLENIAWLIYFAEMLDPLRGIIESGIFWCLLVLGSCALFVFLVWGDDDESDPYIPKIWKVSRTTGYILVSLVVLTVFIPSSKTLYLMIGSSGAVEVLTSDTAKELGGKSLEFLNAYLEENTKQLKGE